MYGRLWRRLPGGTGTKALAMLLLAVAAFAVLWLVVFPWVYTTFPV
jgi:hypothetical protein